MSWLIELLNCLLSHGYILIIYENGSLQMLQSKEKVSHKHGHGR